MAAQSEREARFKTALAILEAEEDAAPYVVAVVDGGLVEHQYLVPGSGSKALDAPELDVLDFDREDASDLNLRDFIEYATDCLKRLKADPSQNVGYLLDKIDRIQTILDA